MSWVGAGIIAGGSILGGVLQGNAAQNAAQTQANAAGQAGQLGQGMYTQNQQNLSPYLNSGGQNLNYLNYLLGTPGYNTPLGGQMANPNNLPVNPTTGKPYTFNDFYAYDAAGDPNIANATRDANTQFSQYQAGSLSPTGSIAASQMPGGQQGPVGAGQPGGFGSLTQPFGLSQFQTSPGYQFNLQQGQQAIDKAAAARGNFYAPQTLQDVSKFSQGLASNEYQQALQNYMAQQQQQYGMLSGQSQQGLQAGGALANVSIPYSQMAQGNITGAGNAIAAGQIGQANAFNPALSALTNPELLSFLFKNQQTPTPTDTSQFAAG
jgi:hypothetical protein